MSWGAVSGQTVHAPLWTGSQFVYVVPGPRGPFKNFKGDSVRLSCRLPALQASQTEQRIAVWKCENRIFPLTMIICNSTVHMFSCYFNLFFQIVETETRFFIILLVSKSGRIIFVSCTVIWDALHVSCCVYVCDYGSRKLRNFRGSTEKRLCFPILKDFWERTALKPQRNAKTRLGKQMSFIPPYQCAM